MFTSIFFMAVILVIMVRIDFKKISSEKQNSLKIAYWLVFGMGFIGTAVYVFDPLAPDLINLIQGKYTPIKEWVSS